MQFLRTLVHDFRWFHIAVGLVGNLLFVVGSVLFLPAMAAWQTAGVWMFIAGSGLMFLGALGELLKQTLSMRGTRLERDSSAP
ncbi:MULTISPECIES: YrhK family protein [Novosphingobium]|uniref:YrhK family protein n=1 Tax=Novosphingobium decolorationis TaxID=2698673 RepID=A0ABX8DZQ0_9SPHN|nr:MULTISPECIES: YrhK family protein [Novosphingobium]MED5547252.1 YrhK family protein [Pseudomonadota bacterium]QVM82321.1 YrhK family protein [Novosphingobium decolorationis]GAM07093.1 hypothetical conserved protein [Novosphingobium sp. MBES04]